MLTSRYPQGDAARMGVPGEKGPNGLPVSMAALAARLRGIKAAWLGEGSFMLCTVSQRDPLNARGSVISPTYRQGAMYKMGWEASGLAPNSTVKPWLLAIWPNLKSKSERDFLSSIPVMSIPYAGK